MTDKRTIKGIDKVKDSIEQKNYTNAISNSKTIIDKLILDSHYWLFKTKPNRKPLYPVKQVEKILTETSVKPELKKLINKKAIKQTLKWYEKYKDYSTDTNSKPAKNPSKFAKKTFHIITLLNISAAKIKANFSK